MMRFQELPTKQSQWNLHVVFPVTHACLSCLSSARGRVFLTVAGFQGDGRPAGDLAPSGPPPARVPSSLRRRDAGELSTISCVCMNDSVEEVQVNKHDLLCTTPYDRRDAGK